MAHYIDKDALVAEIEKKREDYINSLMTEQVHVLNDVLDFINTLEVKEVDLDKEEERIWKDFNMAEWRLSKNDLEKISKHFFELGLKTKGE